MIRNFCLNLIRAGWILIYLFFFACGSSNQTRPNHRQFETPNLLIPAGVDSNTAMEAFSLADDLFVSYEEEEKAAQYKKEAAHYIEQGDSLWKYLTMKIGEKTLTREDTLAFTQAYNEGVLTFKKIIELQQRAVVDTAELAQLLQEEARLLDLAQTSLENAIRHNPFDHDARNVLAYVYRLQAARLGREGNLPRVAEILERLTRMIRGEHTLFASLGETYFAMKDWQKSFNAFKEAERVLLETTDLALSSLDTLSGQIDSTAWFQYVYYQGFNATNMRKADLALEHLQRALKLAATPQARQTVQSVIDWINWDSGNIAASEERDRIFELEAQKRYQEAVQAYTNLLPRLRTQKAKDEIQWRLALLEFNFNTDAARELAVKRLQSIVERLEMTNMTKTDSLPPTTTPEFTQETYPDSLKKRYYNAYGTMLYNLGGQYMQRKSRRTAFTYFYKAASFPWNGQAKALLQVGIFSQNDPSRAILFGEKALELQSQLTEREKKQLYSLLAQLYKQIGNFARAREFFKLWSQK